jgi:hypothetical protein
MEFLSRQLPTSNNNSAPVNLVIQSPKSEAAGFDASKTPGFDLHSLPFRPDNDFHEYRFDWLPGQISFYADNQLLRVMTEDIPTSPGHAVLNHWSNGDPAWSAGPPKEDAVFTVSHAHFYFNSSSPEQNKRYKNNCPKPDNSRVCKINDPVVMPLIPIPPKSPSGTTSSTNPSNATIIDPEVRHTVLKKGSLGFIITGAVVGLFIILFVIAMITVRHWRSWRNGLCCGFSSRRNVSPDSVSAPLQEPQIHPLGRPTHGMRQKMAV